MLQSILLKQIKVRITPRIEKQKAILPFQDISRLCLSVCYSSLCKQNRYPGTIYTSSGRVVAPIRLMMTERLVSERMRAAFRRNRRIDTLVLLLLLLTQVIQSLVRPKVFRDRFFTQFYLSALSRSNRMDPSFPRVISDVTVEISFIVI